MSSSYDKRLYTNNMLVKKIKSLEHSDKETIYLIIKIYMLKFDKKSPLSIPYDGRNIKSSDGKNDIEFDLEKFPSDLVKILNIFIKEIIKKK
jgi:hypothetical protein